MLFVMCIAAFSALRVINKRLIGIAVQFVAGSGTVCSLFPHVERRNDFPGLHTAQNHSVISKVDPHTVYVCTQRLGETHKKLVCHTYTSTAHYDNSLVLKWVWAAQIPGLRHSVLLSASWCVFSWFCAKHYALRTPTGSSSIKLVRDSELNLVLGLYAGF